MPGPQNQHRHQGGHPGDRRHDDRPRTPEPAVSDDQVQKILDRDGGTIVKVARDLARDLKDLKSSQLRNFYGSLLKIEAKYDSIEPEELVTEFQLLRPKLHYMANRDSNARALKDCFDVVLKKACETIDKAPDKGAVAKKVAKAVFDFAEAVVAYHKER